MSHFTKKQLLGGKNNVQKGETGALGRDPAEFRLLVPAETGGKLGVLIAASGLSHPGPTVEVEPLAIITITLENKNHSFQVIFHPPQNWGMRKKKGQLNPGTQSVQPTDNHSHKPDGLGSSRVEVVTNSWEGEADKGTSFVAGEKCLYNYISGLTPLAESERCKGILRPLWEQTLGGDKDLRSCS